MKSITNKFNLLAFVALFAVAFTFTSCEEDPIRGCTDSEAENYDALAVESDGSCTYARDKFLGDYVGALACPGLLGAISNPDFTFSIAEGLAGGVGDVGVTLNNLGVTINGTVSGNVITLDSEIPGYPFDATGDGMPDFNADLTVTGSATTNDDGATMSGQLDITAKSSDTGATLGSDSCTIDGTKQ